MITLYFYHVQKLTFACCGGVWSCERTKRHPFANSTTGDYTAREEGDGLFVWTRPYILSEYSNQFFPTMLCSLEAHTETGFLTIRLPWLISSWLLCILSNGDIGYFTMHLVYVEVHLGNSHLYNFSECGIWSWRYFGPSRRILLHQVEGKSNLGTCR